MPPILRPATIRYECHGCGDCCRLAGAIPLRAEEAADLAKLEWSGELEYLREAKTVVKTKDSKGRSFHRLGKQADGEACIFLAEDNRCLIHQEFGENRKPDACLQFPRTRLSMDGQTVEHYALICRCVELLTEPGDVLMPSERSASDTREKEIGVTLNLANSKPLHWKPFEDVWEDVSSFFENEKLTILQAMRCTWKYLSMNFEGDPNLESGKMMRDAFRDSLPNRIDEMPFAKGMDATQRSLFFQLVYYAINPAPIDFFEQSIPAQSMARNYRLKVGENFRDEKGAPIVRNKPLKCSFEDVRVVTFENGDGELKMLLRAFLLAKGPTLRFHQESNDDALSSIHVLLLALPQAIWLAKALAADEGRSHGTADDLVRAIRIVDSGVGNVDSAMFKGKMREAWQFLFRETDFAAAAVADFVS